MQALASEVSRRRLRLKDYFQDYDRLRSGNVSADQFRRVLATADVMKVLQPGDVDDFLSAYGDGATVRYATFVRDLDENELAVPATRTEQAVSLPAPNTVAFAAFNACAQQAAATGTDARRSFQAFDKHNNGNVTSTQFQRSFPFKVDPLQLEAIRSRYESNGMVNFFAFDADLKRFAASQRAGATSPDWKENTVGANGTMGSPVSPRRAAFTDVEQTLSELKYHLHKEQVNLLDYFKDFDRLRNGVVTAGQFSSVLGRVVLRGFKLSQEALDKLVSAYTVRDAAGERVSYSKFLQHLEAAPMGGPCGGQIDESAQRRLDAVLDKVRSAIRTRRVNLKPTFQDYDRASKGIYLTLNCTRKRFERALTVNNITLSTADVDILEQAYSINRAGETDSDAINYVAFCRDVDIPEGGVESPSAVRPIPTVGAGRFNATTGATHLKKDLTLAGVLDVAMLQLADRSIRLHEFIKDHDPLRSGVVARDKLATAISVSGLKLQPDEVDLLLDSYAVPHSDKVAYPKLLAALDCDAPAEHDKTLHRVDEARARVQAQVQAATQAMHSTQLDIILQRIKDDVSARQILLPPFFQDYDKHHRGSITAAQFERVVNRHKLPVSPSDMQVLKQYFADPADANNVRCRDFIAAVDAAESSRLPKYLREKADATLSSPTRAAGQAAVRTDLQHVLEKIGRAVLSRSIRIVEFFRDADPLRKGFCHESRFAGALSGLGIGLTSADIAVLNDEYRSDKAPNSIDYAQFSREIEQLESQRAAGNATITAKGISLKAAPPQGDLESAAAIVEADPFLQKLFEQIRNTAGARRMSLRGAIQDFDKLRKGRIPSTQLYSALSANGIKFTVLETSKLNELLGTPDGMMNYNIFCRLAGE